MAEMRDRMIIGRAPLRRAAALRWREHLVAVPGMISVPLPGKGFGEHTVACVRATDPPLSVPVIDSALARTSTCQCIRTRRGKFRVGAKRPKSIGKDADMIDRVIGVHRTPDLCSSVPIWTWRRDGRIADIVANDACSECLVPRDRARQYGIELVP